VLDGFLFYDKLIHIADGFMDTDGRDGKRVKSLDKGGVSGPIILYDVHQLQHSNQVRLLHALWNS
jgi:hypothetical protein